MLSFFCGLTVLNAIADGVPATSTNNHRTLEISRTVAKIPAGKATLTLGLLQRTNDTFGCEFQMKVSPYFFKSDKGNVVITITDAMIAKAAGGATVEIAGTATSSEKKNVVRQIKAIATPVDGDHGALKLWVMAEDRTLFFETNYKFVQ